MTDATRSTRRPPSSTSRRPAAGTRRHPIHRFDVQARERTDYRASGEVAGRPAQPVLAVRARGRAARRDDEAPVGAGGRRARASSRVLAERDDRLAQVGQVGGLGRGERIYSVRFIGDRGYVVTFREIDPLYTVDLSDPTAPRVTGELKILGYSAYLHPVGDDLLLGVGPGRDATEGARLGTQLSLFDVSDPAEPARLHQRTARATRRSSRGRVRPPRVPVLGAQATSRCCRSPREREITAAAIGLRVYARRVHRRRRRASSAGSRPYCAARRRRAAVHAHGVVAGRHPRLDARHARGEGLWTAFPQSGATRSRPVADCYRMPRGRHWVGRAGCSRCFSALMRPGRFEGSPPPSSKESAVVHFRRARRERPGVPCAGRSRHRNAVRRPERVLPDALAGRDVLVESPDRLGQDARVRPAAGRPAQAAGRPPVRARAGAHP